MQGSGPSVTSRTGRESTADVEELDDADVIDASVVEGERASLLHAAANARNASALTGTFGIVAMPLDRAAVRLPAPADLLAQGQTLEAVGEGESEAAALLRAHAAAQDPDDPVADLRAGLELAYAELADGRAEGARASAEHAARTTAHAPAAHALLRTLASGRQEALVAAQLIHVEHLAAHVSVSSVRADFLAEKGSLLEAQAGPSPTSVAAYAAALALVPDHARALVGLEGALERTERWGELAEVLGRLANLAGDASASAWLDVERALVLDRRLGEGGSARAVLEDAVERAPDLGAVRDACVDHAVVHRDDARLAALLESEAAIETGATRASCLDLDAALAHLRLGNRAEATKLLERAHRRPRTSSVVDGRVATELARVFEQETRYADALRVRKAALRFVSDPRAEVVALRVLADVADRAGDLSEAVLALERARVLDADDPTLLEDFDRFLERAGRHEARAVLWVREAALADDASVKAAALLVAAEAALAAGRAAEAARHREAAWLADPAAPGIFDVLTERVAEPASKEAVAARVALYEKAIERTEDLGKRVHYLEKIAWLWDDVAAQPAAAAAAYEAVLAIEPGRRSAIAGLASAAARAGQSKKLASALLMEANAIEDEARKGEVRLRAAEALREVDPERALALAEGVLASPKKAKGKAKNADVAGHDGGLAVRARRLITRLHAAAGRWELVAEALSERRAAETKPTARVSLALAEAAVLAQRVGDSARALRTLEAAEADAPGDPALVLAIVATLEASDDRDALRAKLAALAESSRDTASRVAYLLRAGELAEQRKDGDAEAVRFYTRALEIAPEERLVAERLRRLGARSDVSFAVVPPLLRAVRSLEKADSDPAMAETLLALAHPAGGDGAGQGASDRNHFATLRVAERLARRGGSIPQLANAFALEADATKGILAMRALAGLASLVKWALPESDDLAPWDRMVLLGSRDGVVLDDLVRRARPKLGGGDGSLVDLVDRALARRIETAADDTERLVLHVERARTSQRAGRFREAVAACRDALGLEAASLGAAVVLASVAAELGDRRSAALATTTLANITRTSVVRARLLRDAADLTEAEGDRAGAAELIERALDADPENVVAAARLAQIRGAEGAWAELARALRRGLQNARTSEAVVPMAAELAQVAIERLKEPPLAIEALERSRRVAPGHVPALFRLAELYIGQRTWDEALRALADVVAHTTERDEKLVALAGRASILARVLGRPADAEKDLRAALTLDPHDARALRGLLALSTLTDPRARADLLSRLVVADSRPEERVPALLELARLRRELGDASGAEGALVEAASSSPDPKMLARLREAAGGDAETAARVIGRALARAREAGATPGADWLTHLGELELGLGRLDAAIERFEEALSLEPFRESARLMLARALGRKGRHETAASALAPLLDAGAAGALDVTFVRQLEEALSGAGRTQQALVARELRAIAGDLDESESAALASRRPMSASNGESLSGRVLRSFVMPGGLGKHALWDAAVIASGLAGKLARVALAEQGASARDRLKPRVSHPVRRLFDRLTQVFELYDVELALSDEIAAPAVACEDVTWVVAPVGLGDWPEPHAIASLARPLTRVALGVPWLGALSAEDTLAIVVAFARQGAPSVTATAKNGLGKLIAEYDPRARRAIDRRRRKALEDIEPELARAPLFSVEEFAEATVRTEVRASFLLSGDLRATLDAASTTDPGVADARRAVGPAALHAVLSRPISRDVVSFALGADATAIRRSLGTLWS